MLSMEQERKYTSDDREDYKSFLSRVFADQADAEPLRIVSVLTEIIVTELHGQPYQLSAIADPKGLTLTVIHEGHPIDGRMVKVIENGIDEAHYRHDRQGRHELTIRRNIHLHAIGHGKQPLPVARLCRLERRNAGENQAI